MAESKKDPKRKHKVEQFKEQAKQKAIQAATPKTHMIPETTWQSDDILEMRGDIAEALEFNLAKSYEHLQKAGQAFGALMQLNIQAGKVKINYVWNNGEIPTPQEVKDWTAAQEFLQAERQKKIDAMQAEMNKNANDAVQASTSGLITPGGQPLTAANLESEQGSRIIT